MTEVTRICHALGCRRRCENNQYYFCARTHEPMLNHLNAALATSIASAFGEQKLRLVRKAQDLLKEHTNAKDQLSLFGE